jgi:triphosphoribosyl-dephospho-CoA synthetase
MSIDFPWEAWFGLGLLLLALAIVWGLMQTRSRNRANDKVSDEAARLLREHGGERYEREDEPRLRRELRPNK